MCSLAGQAIKRTVLCNHVENIAVIGGTELGEGPVTPSMSQEISGHLSAIVVKALRLPRAQEPLIAEN